MEIVLLGHMGRDEAVVDRLKDHTIHVLGQWYNPGLEAKAKASGGEFRLVDSVTNVQAVADFVESKNPDMFLTNFDSALAKGVVDEIASRVARRDIKELYLPCPNQAAAEVESDKFMLREIIDEIDSKYNPINFMVQTQQAANEAIDFFEASGTSLALKPRNLTGGKGVKVMGKHFDTFEEARALSQNILEDPDQTGLEVQEKLEGYEFTLQIFTDGVTMIRPPVTYDYPYRKDGDLGPGTGGMGSFSMAGEEHLPFLTDHDYEEAMGLLERVLVQLKERGIDYKGVLYGSFFKTATGLKIVEINTRGGDPELINTMDRMEDDVDFGAVLKHIATGELREDEVRYKKLASTVLYLVPPKYGYEEKGPRYTYSLNPQIIAHEDCLLRYAGTELIGGHRHKTVGVSRTAALSALAPTPWEARTKIHRAIRHGFSIPLPLEFRDDVGDEAYIKAMGW